MAVTSVPTQSHLSGPKRGGANMLMPSAYDDIWTALDDGVFNDYPTPLTDEQVAANSRKGYRNRNRSATVPIGPNTVPITALVGLNEKRVQILMQNNSTATGTDVAPTMYFNFGAQAIVGIGIGLAPGVGLVLDNNVQADALYVTFGPSVNTGDSVVIQGAVLETSKGEN
jgi:hypothetical protein